MQRLTQVKHRGGSQGPTRRLEQRSSARPRYAPGRRLPLSVCALRVGQRLLRAFDRAARVHPAMLACGFDGELRVADRWRWLCPAGPHRLIDLLGRLSPTRIVATHDLSLVLQLCPRALLLHEGPVVADAAPASLFAGTERLRRCRFEPPDAVLKPRRPPCAS